MLKFSFNTNVFCTELLKDLLSSHLSKFYGKPSSLPFLFPVELRTGPEKDGLLLTPMSICHVS